MKIAFTTVDLYPGREWLMPWRTVIEVCNRMNAQGIKADVVTVPVSQENNDYNFQGTDIKTAPRDFSAFCRWIENKGYDVLIYPTPFREVLKGNFKVFSNLKIKKIAYFPGGVYSMSNNLALWKYGSFSLAKPYIIDTLTPYRYFTNVMKKCGFSSIVGLSQYTANTIKKSGFPNTACILPGKDDFDKLEEDLSIFEKFGIDSKEKYLLFTGAPAPTRGAQVLAEACRLMDEGYRKTIGDDGMVISEKPKVVFLMRHDVGSDFSSFMKAYDRITDKESFQLITEKVTRNELKTLMAHAHGVILPFLVIPSEIPITYFEVLSLGVPIITFDNNGTTEYLKDAILTCKSGDVEGLKRNILKLYYMNDLRHGLSSKAKELMESHPSWDEVTDQWIELINR